MNDTIGIYYERPDGCVAYTHSWCGREGLIGYSLDDDEGPRTVTVAEFQTWTPRRDLDDFPNARDPRLPYVFDLFWDIKRRSELLAALDGDLGHSAAQIAEMSCAMTEHGVTR